MAAESSGPYTVPMSGLAKACTGAWGVNVVAACAMGGFELGHVVAVLLVFAAVFFLFAAPLHVLLGLGSWAGFCVERAAGEAVAARRALLRLYCAESALFWAAYWGMVLGLLPLTIRG